MKLFMFGGGIIFFIGGIILFINHYSHIEVQTRGIIVQMRIEELPSGYLGIKDHGIVTLRYEGKAYTKIIGQKFVEDHSVGDFVNIKFLKGYSFVLFPNESIISELVSCGILSLFGVIMILYQLKKNRK